MENLINEAQDESNKKTFEKICNLQKLTKKEATLRANCKKNI